MSTEYFKSIRQEEIPEVILNAMGPNDELIEIAAVFEGFRLVELRFLKNPTIPQIVMKVIGISIRFQYDLKTLTIKMGLNSGVLYEISKFLPYSVITDICLDGSSVPEGNYYVLLENQNNLKNLSLSRCNIDDESLKYLALQLCYPRPAYKTLAILNLSSNYITNIGAVYLAEALRTNRQLYYLNMSDNHLSDEGVISILNVLLEFPLTYEEIIEKRIRFFEYIKNKNDIIDKLINDIKADADKKSPKRKINTEKQTAGKKIKIPEKEKFGVELKGSYDFEEVTQNILGPFDHPYSKANIKRKNGYEYSLGNNIICYLNFAYNNLTYCILPKIVKVLKYQELINRKPKGLYNIIIDGNNMPGYCHEFTKIERQLEAILFSPTKLSLLSRRKTILTKPTR